MSGGDDPSTPWLGLQNERTTLAWIRTALSLLGTGVLAGKQSGSTAAAIVVILVAAGAAGVMILGSERRHHRRGLALEAGDPVVGLHHLLATAAVTTAVCLAALMAVLV